MEKTLLIIKPDAVERNLIGEILKRIEETGFKITGLKMLHLNSSQARKFYAVHQGKPFLDELVSFMSSSPVVIARLEKENAVSDLRQIIGATDPKKAEKGTIRFDLAVSLTKNSVHASDSKENAKIEVEFFFKGE
jgi:nucleoside-diphosphate kinase